jgi:hypothetical protein
MVVPMQKVQMWSTKTLHSTTPKAGSPIVAWKPKKKEQQKEKHTTAGIRQWSPT